MFAATSKTSAMHRDASEPPTSGDPDPPTHRTPLTIRDAEEARAQRWDTHSRGLDALWGSEPPYTHQAEDDSSWVMGALFYTWIGDFMFRAAREELTMASMPTPVRDRRVYATGQRFSHAVRRQRECEHGWDNYVGLRVEYRGVVESCPRRAWHTVLCLVGLRSALPASRVPTGSTGVLRWVGNVQQLRTGRQRYVGVEWDHRVREQNAAGPGPLKDGVTIVLVDSGSDRGGGDGKMCAPYHNGTLNGEKLFETAGGANTATCEVAESIVFIDDGSWGSTLPDAMHTPPHGMSMAAALFQSLGLHLLIALPIRFVRDTCTVSVPLILKVFIDYIERTSKSPATAWGAGLALALCFFLFSFTQCVTVNKYFHLVDRAAFIYRSSLCATVFEKCMTISNRGMANPALNAGRIVNMVSSDAQKVQGFTMWAWASLGALAQLICGIAILYYLVGWSAFVGLAVLVIPLPLQWRLTQWLFSVFDEKAVITDERLKATNEFLSGIRVVKFMSWEPSFIVKIEELRRREVLKLRKIQNLFALTSLCNTAVPSLVIASVFVVFTYTGNTLTPSIIFPVISLMSVLQMPFDCIPLVASAFTQFIVSMRRITRFVECEDIESQILEMTDALEQEAASDAARRCRPGESEALLAMQTRDVARFTHATVSASVPQKTLYPEFAEAARAATAAAAAAGTSSAPAKNDDDADDETGYYQMQTVDLLKNVDLRIPRGKLTMIIGPTGCGKSTLLDTLIGALEVTQGEVRATRSIAYVPQQPWIMNATLRDNVLFFSDVDAARFDAAVSSSQLRADLALLADGLETEIGERGINLSGGQKARVSLARAVYADKELYLLDDPLSALDAHVGERVMHECILGALSGKTRVLATHQVHFAREADYVVELGEGGRVVFWGDAAAYAAQLDAKEELPSSSPASPTVPPPPADQIDAGSPLLGDGTTAIAQKDDGATKPAPGLLESSHSADAALGDGVADEADQPTKDTTVPTGTTDGKLISEEERAEGVVALSVYKRYAMACGGLFIWGCVFALYAVSELAVVSPALWLALWTTHSSVAATVSDATGLTIYLCLTILCVSALPLRFFFTYAVLRRGGLNMHSTLLRVVAAGTMQFFDSTPLGRIVNRFSKDVSQLDDTIQQAVVALFSDSCTVISSVCIMVATQPLILVVLVPCLYVYYRLAGFYNAANRNLRRQTNLTGSPVMTLISTVATGRWTIMAYHKGSHIMREALRCLDQVFCTQYMGMVGNCWFSVRIGLLSNTLVTAIALLGVWQVNRPLGAGPNAAEDRVNLVGVLALSMTMTMSISLLLTSVVKYAAELEADMNSVERVLYYIDNVSQEPGLMDGIEDAIQAHAASIEAVQNKAETAKTTENAKDVCVVPITPSPTTASPATGSPNALLTVTAGSLAFEHVDMRYRAGLPLVLRDVSFTIAPGQKVGVVGRTGSGKSTLLLAFLRLVDICGGRMVVNGRDAKDYDLRELRLLFSMIPQDPLLFDGTVRSNVDPFGESSDGAVWGALRHVGMAERVRSEAGGLDGRVQEGGSNFSVGQRQLLCLARALLKRGSAFLLMDEATANVDPALDRQIQRTVQDVFAAYTVVTIAHRLHTVARYDVIIVMDGGRVLESGSPRELVTRADSHFAGLVRSMGAEAQSKFMDALP